MPADVILVKGNILSFQGKAYRCAVGANGFTDTPREGDKATPLGTYYLRECWYRPDRVAMPETGLPLKVITKQDGWCDAPGDPNYNRHITLPYPASHETLWREDSSYDIVVPIGFNDDPVVNGLGSAIFFHIARPDYAPTLGCVAIALADMRDILKEITSATQMIIEA